MTERIRTQHPDPNKRGVHIEKAKYDAMRAAILTVTPTEDGISFTEISTRVKPLLPTDVFGPKVSVAWYCVSVKLDLEARGLIQRVPKSRPVRLIRVG